MRRFRRPTARKIQTQADIVFCVDITASMNPCIEGVRNGMQSFADGLQSAASVNFRLRLIGYRDLHDITATNEEWSIFPFTEELEEFRRQLASLRAGGGGDAPESTLDAIYLGIHSKWRQRRTHKTVVVMTDADTHPTLHSKTYQRPDNNIYRVIQDFQELRHAMLFIVAPKYPLYSQLEQSMNDAERKVIARWVPKGAVHTGLSNIDWEPLMTMLGQVVSATSIVTSQDDK